MRKVVAILEVMWDWRSMTSSAGYEERAPGYYRINPDNFTGSRLYDWLGTEGQYYDDLLVTNACPQLVCSPTQRGTPDKTWLRDNIKELLPFELLLVCGRVAQRTYEQGWIPRDIRIIELPHPAARVWTRESLAFAKRLIQEGKSSLCLEFRAGRLVAEPLIPF